jgi:hypothetical protein
MRTLLAFALTAFMGLAAKAADEVEDPGLDFLEYLGSWQAEDEEWVIAAEWENPAETKPDGKPEPERKLDE